MLRYHVNGMTCGHCVQAITRAITALDPTAKVAVDLRQKLVTAETGASERAVADAIRNAGYEATAA